MSKLFAILFSATAWLAAPAFAQQPTVIKFSHVTTAGKSKGNSTDHFKNLAGKSTTERVKVDLYPNSTLHKDKEEIEALQLGTMQTLAPSLAKWCPLGIREYEVFDLPYIFDHYSDLHNLTQGPVGYIMIKKLESRGVAGLAYWDDGFRQMTANRPLNTPEDFKCLRMRIQSSKMLDAQFCAIPQVSAFLEVYQAMQTGIVDGSENTALNIYTKRHHEAQKYLTTPDYGYIGYTIITDNKFWDGLPTDIRSVLGKVMKDATQYANDITKKENDNALEAILKSSKTQIYTLSAQGKSARKMSLFRVHQLSPNTAGKELLQAIYNGTGFDSKS
jgi:C4-dicarboxylate-binding protein DctP